MPKTKRFQNLLKSVMGVPPSTESASSNANSEPETTSQFSPSFYARTLPNPSPQERSLPAPSLLVTRHASFSFQRASSLQAAGQETPSFKATRLETPSFKATRQETPSFKATRLETPSFQATRQETSSLQGTSLPAPSLQAVGQQNPSFQTTRQTTSLFRATRQPSRQPSHSFQDESSSSINDTSHGAPSINPMPPQSQRNKRARESTHHWTVDGIDSQGNVKRLKLKTNEVLSLPQGVRVVVQFDLEDPIGEASSLLAGFCGILATDCSIFPIGFEKWPDMPQSYFEDCFDNIIKPLFSFMAPDDWARRHVYHSIVKKWGASRQKLWREFHDPLKTKEQHMANVPIGIARDQWTSFVNYRLKDKTVRMCLRNAENRKKLTDPHGGGSKSNARRRGEIIVDTGRRPGRAEMYLITRKKEDGSYVSEGAKEICEKLELALSQSTVDESEASPNDAVGKVLGKEHPGRVRCLGLGATPTIAFKQTNRRVSGMRFPSNDAGCSSGCQVKYNQLLNTLKAYMIMKEGSIPAQFAGIFDSHPTMAGDATGGSASSSNSARNFSNDVIEEPFR